VRPNRMVQWRRSRMGTNAHHSHSDQSIIPQREAITTIEKKQTHAEATKATEQISTNKQATKHTPIPEITASEHRIHLSHFSQLDPLPPLTHGPTSRSPSTQRKNQASTVISIASTPTPYLSSAQLSLLTTPPSSLLPSSLPLSGIKPAQRTRQKMIHPPPRTHSTNQPERNKACLCTPPERAHIQREQSGRSVQVIVTDEPIRVVSSHWISRAGRWASTQTRKHAGTKEEGRVYQHHHHHHQQQQTLRSSKSIHW
jgi:hypothetical protein